MKTVKMGGAIIHLNESKAVCPYCDREIHFDEIEPKWMKRYHHTMRMKCKCTRFIGITTNWHGDFVSFDLKQK